jgi:hydroxyquinol 1,2-dioxygenase
MAAGTGVGQVQRLGSTAHAAGLGDLHKQFDLGPAVHACLFVAFAGKVFSAAGIFFVSRAPYIVISPGSQRRPQETTVRNLDQYNITEAVIARLAQTPDPRLKQVLTSLVQHLHAFAREVRLTEAEWAYGIDFLTRVGHTCDDERQEFILLSDTLGLSMLTVALNNDKPAGCTEATVFGPFHVEGAPQPAAWGRPGQWRPRRSPAPYDGSVRGLDGRPVAGAVIDVWQADAEGKYDVQRDGPGHAQGRGVLRSRRRWPHAISAASWPRPTRSPTTARWARCCGHPAPPVAARRTCTSASRRRATRR